MENNGFGERRRRKVGKRKGTTGSTSTYGFICRYQVACMVSLLFMACMAYACGLLVMICHMHGGFPGLTVVFPSLSISWITMVIVGLFSLIVFWLVFMIPLAVGLSY